MWRGALAECERVRLNAGTGKGDLEGAAGNGAGLADQLVQPLLADGAVALVVSVGSVRGAGRFSIAEHAEPGGGSGFCWPHDEVEVTGVEAADDLPAGRVQRGGLLPHRPVPGQRPLVEPERRRGGVML